MCLKNEGIT
jgi:hypothetical protein